MFQGSISFVKLGHFNKYFVTNARKEEHVLKKVGNFSPRYSQNYILNGKLNPKMDTIRVFLSLNRST